MPQYWPIQWPGPSVLSAGRLLLNAVYLRLTTPLGVCLELAAATPPLPPFRPIVKLILKKYPLSEKPMFKCPIDSINKEKKAF